MKPLYILLLALLLCGGCRTNSSGWPVIWGMHNGQTYSEPAKTNTIASIDPRQANVGSQMLRAASNISAPDTLAVVLPPPAPVPPAFRFADGFLDNVWCLQSSTDLIDWVNVEPNPQAPQFPVWHWGYGDGLGNVPTNLPPNTSDGLIAYRWKGTLW